MNRWIGKARNLGLLAVRWSRHAIRQGPWVCADDFRIWVRTSLVAPPEVLDIPWVTMPAVRWLRANARPDWSVFEWGSGASTLFLARAVGRLVSIEHDGAWYGRIAERVRLGGHSNVDLRLVEPEPEVEGVPDEYRSSSPFHDRLSFRAYVSAIDAFPDTSFDLVLVDGRARPGCMAHAAAKVRPGGALLLDNAERPAYAGAIHALEAAGWRRHSLAGPVPSCRWPGFADTSIFVRPGASTSSSPGVSSGSPPRRAPRTGCC